MPSDGLLRVHLSPDSHPSLAMSCADKLLWIFADKILQEAELAIAYPCLSCRGGLAVFLAYLAIAIEENPPGCNPDPILIYPGTVELRQAYTELKVQVGDLLDALRQRRVSAQQECFVHRWEENILRGLRRGRFSASTEFPLHDFFPAAVLDESGSPRIFAGRNGFGRGDDTPPPLQFAPKILRVSPRVRYRAAVIMYDAVDSRSERQRLSENLECVRAGSLIHLFESPYSPTFAKMTASEKRCWRMRAEDFVSGDSPVPADEEVKRALKAERRIHSVPSPLSVDEYRALSRNFRELRQIGRTNSEATEACTRLYNCYRLLLTLPVPTGHYDAVADQIGFFTLADHIDEVKEVAEALGPGVAYSLVDESTQILRSLLDKISTDQARSRALLVESRRAFENGNRIGIVVFGPVFASAIERFLSAELNCEPLSLPDKKIHVIEVRSLPHLEPFDTLLFFGYRGAWVLRWMMSGRAKEIVTILTDQERWAVDKDLKAATRGHNAWNPGRTVATESPESTTTSGGDESASYLSSQEKRLIETLGNPEPDLPVLPLDDDEFVRDLLDYTPPARTSLTAAVSTATRSCRKVIFRNCYAYLPEESTVTVLNPSGTAEKRVLDLACGDVVLFVNGSQRRSIYDLMLAEIKKAPAYALSAGIIEAWHRRLIAESRRSDVTVADLHRRLRNAGSGVVRATVAAWLRGGIMSPQETENLRRLFHVLGIPDPDGTYSGRIDEAARHLRNVYRQYAKAVNAFLLRAAGDARPELDALLEKHNLDIESIRESVIAEELEEISPHSIEVASSMVGRLYAL